MPETTPHQTQLATAITALDDATALRILSAIARGRQAQVEDSPPWPELCAALRSELQLPPARGATPDAAQYGEAARQTLLLLAADPDYRQPLTTMLSAPPQRTTFELGAIGATLLITGVLIALRSHVKIAWDKKNKLSVNYEHSPLPTAELRQLLRRLLTLLPGPQV